MKPVDPEGSRLPIKLDTTSNGEFEPVPLAAANLTANRLALASADENSKRLGMKRRQFLVSACGAASTLLAFNQANARAGVHGGFFELPKEAALEPLAARSALDKGEFIFDVQGHFIDTPAGGQRAGNAKGPEVFVKDVFMDSDTDVMVLSFVPSTRDAEPVTIQAADAVRRIVDRLQGTHRLLLHGRVNPNQAGDLEGMDELKQRWGVSAWKTYTQYGPGGRGYFMTDDAGIRFVEKAQALGVKVICIHKGLPFGKQSYEHSQCSDIGPIAKRFPDVKFLIYHSGFVSSVREQAYDHEAKRDGIDTLIRSMIDSGLKPGSNVYPEMGSTWRFLMRDPEQAAHGIGKLLKYVGEDNLLWGTDSIWYGSPQDQIQAFRTFQISPELRARHGYPEITPALRAKIFGLNGAQVYGLSPTEIRKFTNSDHISRERLAYQERPEPHFQTYGPKTRREFLSLLRRSGGSPA
ncbi:MAG: amidohydrolase family protein [Candidatus Parcubacteria bacterium]|nr:amidohydrolase family protein [Burkholderiales bacterium]